MNNRDLQSGVERQWQREWDERCEEETVSDCCESSWKEERDPDGGWSVCDTCKKECNVIEI